jgi:hypothetical protein
MRAYRNQGNKKMNFSLFLANLTMDRKAKTPYTTSCEVSSNAGFVCCLLWGAETWLPYQGPTLKSTPASTSPRCLRVTNRGMCTGVKRMMSPRSTPAASGVGISGMPRELRTSHKFSASRMTHWPRRRTSSSSKLPTSAASGSVPSANGGGH